MVGIGTGLRLLVLVVVHLSPGTLCVRNLRSSVGPVKSTACGRPKFNYRDGRIVGGTTSGYGQYPWQINLYQTKSPYHKCGGALLNGHWIVTAAHCVDGLQARDLLVLIGANNLGADDEAYPFAVRRPGIMIVHPHFNADTYVNDVALLRFMQPVHYQPNILPICLPEQGDNFEGHVARISGWGRLYYDGPFPTKLQHTSVPIISNGDCVQMYRSAGYEDLSIPRNFLCAGYQDGKRDACSGDSGGPLVIQRKDQWILAGIASWGIGCGDSNKPGVYARISEFVDWINELIAL